MENKFMKADYTKKKFTITIDICENANIIKLNTYNNYVPTYQEAIGALEICKNDYIRNQSEANKKVYKSYKKKK